MTNRLSDSLITAYMGAIYKIESSPPISLKINTPNKQLDLVMRSSNADHAAIITAFNPNSYLHTRIENLARQQQLMTLIKKHGFEFFSGRNIDPRGEWPDEESFLILGLDFDCANNLARKFDQNAFVWIEHNQAYLHTTSSLSFT